MITKSAKKTKEIAMKMVENIKISDRAVVFGLRGELGSGKTTFVQGFAEGLEIKDKILSPTFVIFKSFKIFNSDFKEFYHFDCYRIKDGKEILTLGFSEIISNPENMVFIEWPEKIKAVLPKEMFFLDFKFVNINTREILWTKRG